MDINSLILILIVSAALVFFLNRITKDEKSLFWLIITVLLLHLGLLFYMQMDLRRYYHPDVMKSRFFDDGECYSSNGFVISNTLKGKKISSAYFYKNGGIEFLGNEVFNAASGMKIASRKEYQVGFFAYFYAIIYAAYGYAPGFLNFLNILAHLLAAVLIFSLAKEIFNRRTAYLATVLFLLWPTIFYYSTTKVKEPMVVFLAYLLIFILFKLDFRNKKQALFYLFISILILLSIQALRENIIKILVPVIALYLLLKAKWWKFLAAILAIPLAAMIFLKFDALARALQGFMITCAYRHKGFLDSGGIVYQLYGSFSDTSNYSAFEWLLYYLRGWFHLIFEPLFSTGISISFLAYYPFKLIFIALFFLALLGLVLSLRQAKGHNVLLVGFFLAYGSTLALMEGNVGTMIRHRDLIAPIIFIYSAFFITEKLSVNS